MSEFNKLPGDPARFKAITKDAIYPTRKNGMGKIMIEIMDVYLLSNKIVLKDYVIVFNEEGKEIYREIIADNYIKTYTTEEITQFIIMSQKDFSDNGQVYNNLVDVIDILSLQINQLDPPYNIAPNSFEKYVGK